MKVLKKILVILGFLLPGFTINAQTEFENIKDLLDSNVTDKVTLNNIQVLEQMVRTQTEFIVVDSYGNVVKLNLSTAKFPKVGDIIKAQVKINIEPITNTPYLYSTSFEILEEDSQISCVPFDLGTFTGSLNGAYVVLKGTVGNSQFDSQGMVSSTVTTMKGRTITEESTSTEYVIYHSNMGDLSDVTAGKSYLFYGLVDNNLLPNRNSPFDQLNVIRIFRFINQEDFDDLKWKVGVSSSNSEGGKCYISDANATADVSGVVWENVPEGNTVILHAVPNSGYQFKCWSLNGNEVSQNQEYEIRPHSDLLYTAEFEKSAIVEREIIIQLDSESNGKVKIDDLIVENTTQLKIEEGKKVTFEALPTEGYVFDYWETKSGEKIEENPYVTEIYEDFVLIPHFKVLINEYVITIASESVDKGRVKISTNIEVGETFESLIEQGTEISIEAFPSEGYLFSYWLTDNSNQIYNNPYSFVVQQDSRYTAIFKEKEWTVNYRIGSNGSITVTDSEGKPIAAGDKVVNGTEVCVLLTPDDRYQIDEFKVKRGNSDANVVAVDGNKYSTVVTSDIEFFVTFKPDINGIYSLKVAPQEMEGGEILGEVYIDTPGITSISAKYQESHTFYAVPVEYAKFVGWRNSGDNYIRNVGTEDNGVFVYQWLGNCDENLIAVFDYKMTYPRKVSVRSNNENKGTVSIEGITDAFVESRRPVKIIATPLTDYDFFENWTDSDNNIISTDPVFIYTSDEDIELTANFYSMYQVNLSIEGKSRANLYDESGNEVKNGSLIKENTLIDIIGVVDGTEFIESITVNNNPIAFDQSDDLFSSSVLVDRPINIKVLCSIRLYNLTILSSNGGEILVYREIAADGSPKGNKLTSNQTIEHGSTIHIFSNPADGYELTKLTVNGVDITDRMVDSHTSHEVYGHVNLNAEFTSKPSSVYDIFMDADEDDVTIYDLQGRRVNNKLNELRPGIYIIKQNDKVKKIKIQ